MRILRILSWCCVQNETFGYSGHFGSMSAIPWIRPAWMSERVRGARARARARERGRAGEKHQAITGPIHSDFELDCPLKSWNLQGECLPCWINKDLSGSIMISMIYPLHIFQSKFHEKGISQSRGCLGLCDQAIWQIDTTQQASVVRIPQFDVFLRKAQKKLGDVRSIRIVSRYP